MLKVILRDPKLIHPFNEAARDLRLLNKPLWLQQRDVLTPYVTREVEIEQGKPLPDEKTEYTSLAISRRAPSKEIIQPKPTKPIIAIRKPTGILVNSKSTRTARPNSPIAVGVIV